MMLGNKAGKIFLKRGQNLTELALVIGVVGLTLFGMEFYFKRGIQSKVKILTDVLISPDQEAYQQDTSGLAINSMSTQTVGGSAVNIDRALGGELTTLAEEDTIATYTSTYSTSAVLP